MSEPVVIICRLRRAGWKWVDKQYQPALEILPTGEKERGEEPDEMRTEELPERSADRESA